MDKLWQGHLEGKISQAAESFNASISFDSRMYKEDITGSMAHAAMLSKQGIISKEDSDLIIQELGNILQEIEEGKLAISMDAEDIHSFVEGVLTERIGDACRKLHTARSRNDQVALDFRMYVRKETDEVISGIKALLDAIRDKALEYKSVIMPGYTHLQRAQPILFAHHLLAYAQMLLRDKSRLEDMKKRLNVSPIGCCA
ncbi:MAG: argininosuccinate lyase, partial [Spirochaetales bacterium]|nr:argininosuccinate lyase [Candidatus Physcosoma equi]